MRAASAAALLIAAGCVFALRPHFHHGAERESGEREGPESPQELDAMAASSLAKVTAPFDRVPAGAYRAAIEAKAQMQSRKALVPGANGTWVPYGTGPLLSGSGVNQVALNGRIDSFDYDPVAKRLFATFGTGGVWASDDVAQSWHSIGDNLPTQIIGSAAWSAAGGGTVIAASGDPSFGGNDYVGLGAFWTNDLGATWHQSDGVPDGALGFKVAVDHAHPDIVYIGNSKGLFRSTDAGRTFVNVNLPTSPDCAGVTEVGPCQFANFVTDVVVMEPGGATSEAGGQVLAAVGYRQGRLPLADGTVSSPGNGLYRSETGEPDTFSYLDVSAPNNADPAGFASQERIGRVALGAAIGPDQDHNYVYAMVQDAVLMNGGLPTIDAPDGTPSAGALPFVNATAFNGLYVSADFGQSWLRIADTAEIAYNPATDSSLALVEAAAGSYAPGVQARYNLWVRPDPTRTLLGVPTRLLFGLEEIWASRLTNVPIDGLAQQGPDDFHVIGNYFYAPSCANLVNPPLVGCLGGPLAVGDTTTHPDQHAAVFIPDDAGGVTFVGGNDGGAWTQHAAAGEEMDNSKWGHGAQTGFNTLLPYAVAVAKDGTAWFGLQDNGDARLDGKTGEMTEQYGGDGFFTAVDPDDSNTSYEEYTFADMRVTTDGGATWTGIKPTLTGAQFSNPFVMDPTDAKHLMTAAKEVVERTEGPSGSWVQVFDLGTNAQANGVNNQMSAIDLQGDAAYVGFCGWCDLLAHQTQGFHNGLATNVGGDKPPARGTGDGWHFATAAGLPNRYITSIEIDYANPRTVYVTLGGYSNRGWIPVGSYLDTNANIGAGHVFKSTDAGESFVDISGNLPNAHAQWVTLRGDQLLVGTDIGPFISSDTLGGDWAPLGNGMPNVPVAMLTLKPGDSNQLFAATFGRGIWKYEFTNLPPVDVPTTQPPSDTTRFGGAMPLATLLLMLLGRATGFRTRWRSAASLRRG